MKQKSRMGNFMEVRKGFYISKPRALSPRHLASGRTRYSLFGAESLVMFSDKILQFFYLFFRRGIFRSRVAWQEDQILCFQFHHRQECNCANTMYIKAPFVLHPFESLFHFQLLSISIDYTSVLKLSSQLKLVITLSLQASNCSIALKEF